jgi:hypothetical protein
MATKFNKYQYVELQVNVGTANPGFTPQQYLQNRQIYSFEVFSSADVNQARSNLFLATPAMLQGMFLNLYCTDVNLPLQAIPNSSQYNGQGWGLWFRDVPLVGMHRVSTGSNSYVRDLFEMMGGLIDFEQSYINVTPATQALITTGGVPVVVLFGIGCK